MRHTHGTDQGVVTVHSPACASYAVLEEESGATEGKDEGFLKKERGGG